MRGRELQRGKRERLAVGRTVEDALAGRLFHGRKVGQPYSCVFGVEGLLRFVSMYFIVREESGERIDTV